MTRLQDDLLKACNALNIEIEIGYVLSLGEGRVVHTIAHIPSFGGPNGMLIVQSTDEIRPVWDKYLQENYGFSVLSEPDDKERFDLNSYKEMFVDWGWNPPV